MFHTFSIIRIQNFLSPKDTMKRKKMQIRKRGQEYTYLTKDLYLEYIKNLSKAIGKDKHVKRKKIYNSQKNISNDQ